MKNSYGSLPGWVRIAGAAGLTVANGGGRAVMAVGDVERLDAAE